MAKFTATQPLNIEWHGNVLIGSSTTTYRIPDALKDEFDAGPGAVIPGGVAWVETDELADALPLSGGALTGPLSVSGAISASSLSATGAIIGSSLTATTARFKGGPWHDVKAYGAAGDGTTDDTTAIAAALTAAASGGQVFFPIGTYSVSASLSVPSNVTVSGVGLGSKITLSANKVILQIANSASKVVVRDLWIVGAGSTADTLNHGVYGVAITDCLVENVRVEDCAQSIYFNTGLRNTARNCTVVSDMTSGASGGAIDAADATATLVEGCTVLSPHQHGIDIRGSSHYSRVIGCNVQSAGSGTTGTGIVISQAPNHCAVMGNVVNACVYGLLAENGATGNVFSGNIVQDASSDGITLSASFGDSPDNVVSNNVFRSCGRHGVYNNGCGNIVVIGNRIEAYGLDGIRMDSASASRSTVSGNLLTGGTNLGGIAINVLSTASGATVSGNSIYSTVGHGIDIDAAKSVVVGNHIEDCDSGQAIAIGGIILKANASRTVVSSNAVYGTQDYGIVVQTSCTNALLIGNILAGNTTAATSDSGTGTSAVNNVTT